MSISTRPLRRCVGTCFVPPRRPSPNEPFLSPRAAVVVQCSRPNGFASALFAMHGLPFGVLGRLTPCVPKVRRAGTASRVCRCGGSFAYADLCARRRTPRYDVVFIQWNSETILLPFFDLVSAPLGFTAVQIVVNRLPAMRLDLVTESEEVFRGQLLAIVEVLLNILPLQTDCKGRTATATRPTPRAGDGKPSTKDWTCPYRSCGGAPMYDRTRCSSAFLTAPCALRVCTAALASLEACPRLGCSWDLPPTISVWRAS
jgi:hypothetical protein